MKIKKLIWAVLIALVQPLHVYGQTVCTDSLTAEKSPNNYSFEWEQTIFPASLIGVGAVALAPTFIRNGSRSLTREVIHLRGSAPRLEFDDYIQYLPVVGSLTLGCVGIQAKHSFKERVLIIGTSYAALGLLTNLPKFCIDEKRPEFAGRNSFPSGHTATVFMGAELVRIEYGGWYGAGAYTIAVGVGFMRMYNGRHWFHDVVAGAGIGILSARLGEWSGCLWHRLLTKKRKTEHSVVLTPIASPAHGGYYGLALEAKF